MGIEVTAKDIVAVSLECLKTLAVRKVPQFEGLVVRCAAEKPGVRGPGHVRNTLHITIIKKIKLFLTNLCPLIVFSNFPS